MLNKKAKIIGFGLLSITIIITIVLITRPLSTKQET